VSYLSPLSVVFFGIQKQENAKLLVVSNSTMTLVVVV